MAAPYIELVDAIVEDINSSSRDWSMYFQAERSWVPIWIGRDEINELQCHVSNWPDVETRAKTRDETEFDFQIDFGFAKTLDTKTRDQVDDLALLVDNVMRRYVVTDITVSGVGKFVPLRRTDAYFTHDPNALSRTKDKNYSVPRYSGDFMSMFRIPYRFLEPL